MFDNRGTSALAYHIFDSDKPAGCNMPECRPGTGSIEIYQYIKSFGPTIAFVLAPCKISTECGRTGPV